MVKTGHRYIVTAWNVDSGDVRRLVFDEGVAGESWPLVAIEDPGGRGLDVVRDGTHRLRIRQRLEQRSLVVDFDADSFVKSVSAVLPGGKLQPLARYQHDGHGNLTSAQDALGHTDRYEYDDASRLTREIIKDGGVFSFRYDDRGRCVHTSGLDRYDAKTLRYRSDIGWTEVTDSLANVTRFQWLPTGQVVTQIDPLGGVWQTTYDEHDRIIAEIAPSGATTAYTYDESGNRATVTERSGRVTRRTFNAAHQTLTLTDPAGRVWRSEYDSHNRWVGFENPLRERWTFDYDDPGHLVRIKNSRGSTKSIRYTYAEGGASIDVSDWTGLARTTYRLDALGRAVQQIEPSGRTTTAVFDLIGRLVRLTAADGTHAEFSYDAGGNLIACLDSLGTRMAYRYGPCRRLLKRDDPLGGVQRYVWGSEPARLEKIYNEKGEEYSVAYDKAGRVIRETALDGAVRKYEYDADGACVAFTNGAGQRTAYTRDPAGRLLQKTFSDGDETSFEYDAAGNVTRAQNQWFEVRFERDLLGRVTAEQQGDISIDNVYDALGRHVGITTSLGAHIEYEFDANQYLVRVTANGRHNWRFKRDVEGRDVSRSLPGGSVLIQGYDANGQLASQEVRRPADGRVTRLSSGARAPQATIERTYAYDAAGDLGVINDARRGRIEYRYDPLDRIAATTRDSGVSEQFSYDSASNLTHMAEVPGAVAGSASPQATPPLEYGPGNRLLRRGDTSYSYDGNGRLIHKSEWVGSGRFREWSYEWDSEDRLVGATQVGVGHWRYRYDPFGRRLSKTGPDGTTRFVWDRDFLIHLANESAPAQTWIFDPQGFRPLAMVQDGKSFSAIVDHLGTPQELVDDSGNVAWSVDLTTWGKVRFSNGAQVDCSIRFQGQIHDRETGLHYSRFRYYDPETGRFLSRDPLGVEAGLNEFSYATNPVNWVDPLGLVVVYRNLRPEEDPSKGLSAKQPGRDMTPAGHVRNGGKDDFKGSQFISTTTDPAVAAQHREPGQVTVKFDTDNVVHDTKGNLSVVPLTTPQEAEAAGLKGPAKNYATASKEVLVEGHVPAGALEVVDPEKEKEKQSGCG